MAGYDAPPARSGITMLTVRRIATPPALFSAACIAIAGVTYAPPAAAQQLERSVRLTVDNDAFNFWVPPRQRPDDNYTHGARVAWDVSWTPRFANGWICARDARCGGTLEVGQEIYTPTVDALVPVPGDRPYAGWLYARAEVRGARARTRRSLDLTAGITGPPSLAGATQRTLHKLVPDFRQPLGWTHQLPTEIAFSVRARQSWRIAPSGPAGRVVDLVPTLTASVGTLRTAAGAGVRARGGVRLDHPWLASGPSNVALYGFAGVRGELVARDLFLDGTLFRRSIRVRHVPFLGEWEGGVGVRVRRMRLEYRVVTRSREYHLGPRTRTNGSFALSWTRR